MDGTRHPLSITHGSMHQGVPGGRSKTVKHRLHRIYRTTEMPPVQNNSLTGRLMILLLIAGLWALNWPLGIFGALTVR